MEKKHYIGGGIVVALCAIYGIHQYNTTQLSEMDSDLHQQALAQMSKDKPDSGEAKGSSAADAEIQEYGSILEKIQETKVKKALLEQEIALRQVEGELRMARKELGMDTDAIGGISSMDGDFSSSEDQAYKFVMVKQRQGEWHATFSRGGKVYKVKTGDTLPGGYKVHDINEHGTILKKGKEEFVHVF